MTENSSRTHPFRVFKENNWCFKIDSACMIADCCDYISRAPDKCPNWIPQQKGKPSDCTCLARTKGKAAKKRQQRVSVAQKMVDYSGMSWEKKKYFYCKYSVMASSLPPLTLLLVKK